MERPEVQLSAHPLYDRVQIKGFADETLGDLLNELYSRSAGKSVVFDFRDLTAINSSGVRCWAIFLRSFVHGRKVVLEGCAPAFVEQLLMMPALAIQCQVRSVLVPMICDNCRKEAQVEVSEPDYAKWATGAVKSACPSCGEAQTSLVELDAYFEFTTRLIR